MKITRISEIYKTADPYYKNKMYFLNKGKHRKQHKKSVEVKATRNHIDILV